MSVINPANSTRQRARWAAAGVAPLLVVLAACGSSEGAPVASSSSSTAPSASTSADSSTQQLAFAKCMREKGIDIPDPDADGQFSRPPNVNLNDPKFSAALDKCRSLMPNGGPLNQSFDTAAQDKILALVKCLREHRVTVPDPQFDANGKVVLSGGMPQINPNDPKIASAIQACRQYLPSGLSGASGTP